MQIVSRGDNLHEMSIPVFSEKYVRMPPAEFFTRHAKRNSIKEVFTVHSQLSVKSPVDFLTIWSENHNMRWCFSNFYLAVSEH